ncbi:aminodeoxychorismate lyase [Teredinibacter haidensis]|uniref:aminodeoxychorismate lyase n=1 Tax=Teredinibacter haidensis TaxID=2731755 RepID=UPI000948B5D9|nr:aminodeoxychorismate lyase [Teredinibacter haidensis]
MDIDEGGEVLLLNGVEVENRCLSVNNRAFLYGDGVFETLRIVVGKIPFLSQHLQRLQRGSAVLGFRLEIALVSQYLAAIQQRIGGRSGVLKIHVSRSVGVRGSYSYNNNNADILLQFTQNSSLKGWIQNPVSLKTAPGALTKNASLSGIKHLSRLDYIVASKNITLKADEELLFLDDSGNIVETMHHNIFWLIRSELFTPDVSMVGVKGVMRERIIEIAKQELGVRTQIVSCPMEQFEFAGEVFLTNAVRGVVPVAGINQLAYSEHSFAERAANLLQMYC